jgi:hypothetical protein
MKALQPHGSGGGGRGAVSVVRMDGRTIGLPDPAPPFGGSHPIQHQHQQPFLYYHPSQTAAAHQSNQSNGLPARPHTPHSPLVTCGRCRTLHDTHESSCVIPDRGFFFGHGMDFDRHPLSANFYVCLSVFNHAVLAIPHNVNGINTPRVTEQRMNADMALARSYVPLHVIIEYDDILAHTIMYVCTFNHTIGFNERS